MTEQRSISQNAQMIAAVGYVQIRAAAALAKVYCFTRCGGKRAVKVLPWPSSLLISSVA